MTNRDFVDEILVAFGTSPNPVGSGSIKIDYKAEIIQKLVLKLKNASDSSEDDKLELLKCLRVVCMEAPGCESLVNESIIELLSQLARINTKDANLISMPSSVESLKCLSNLQTILPDMRTLFSESQVVKHLVPVLNLDGISLGVAFLTSRLIFFSSAVNPKQSEILLEGGALDALAKVSESLTQAVNADFAGKLRREDWVPVDGFYSEVLKTGFNLTLNTSPLANSALSSVNTVVELDGTDPSIAKYHNYLKIAIRICLNSPLGSPKLSSPHLHAVNTLMNIPCLNPDIWFAQNDYSFLCQLLDIFEESFKIMAPEKDNDIPDDEEIFGSTFDQALIPLCLLLKKLTIIPEARKRIKDRLLPSNIDRTKPLSEGPTLTAALIRAMLSVRLHQTKDFMCDLLVSCFDDNVEKFVLYVGYANAAGYLFNRGIANPLGNTGPKKESLDGSFPDNIDPMTGKIAEPKPNPWAGMTDEEKERESERLFVLFDRLNKSGIIKTEIKRD